MAWAIFEKYINKIKSPFFSLSKLQNNWRFVKETCEENEIIELDDGIVDLFDMLKVKVGELNLTEDQVFGMIVDGIHNLREKERIKKLIQGVSDKIQTIAIEYDKPTHRALNYHLALGIIASYLYAALIESQYIEL